MSVHIGGKPGEIAERVLLPGDPMRAKWIAETFLQDAVCYTEVRGMLGFTGTYQGVRVSVQGSGMGMPALGAGAGDALDASLPDATADAADGATDAAAQLDAGTAAAPGPGSDGGASDAGQDLGVARWRSQCEGTTLPGVSAIATCDPLQAIP